jgi:hypothetical protein
MQPKLIFLLALVVFSPEQSRVTIRAEVPAADFYLDGNLVAQTDANGSLSMEGFPPGTFRFTVRKDGYLPYEGSFTIAEGQSRIIQVRLRKAVETQPSETPPPVKKRPIERKQQPPVAKQPPEKVAPNTNPVTAANTETKAAEDNSPTTIWIIPVGLAILLAAGFIILKLRARRMRMEPPAEPMPDSEEPVEVPAPKRQAPEFVEQLKRREEMIEAGLVSVNAGKSDPINKREKEIVIVLPKEAYTSEEDK